MRIRVAAFLAFAALACAFSRVSLCADPKGVYHCVEKGETLWRIGQAYGVSVPDLVRVNKLEDADYLEVGDLLFIPGAKQVFKIGPGGVRPVKGQRARRWRYIIVHHSATERGNARIFGQGHRRRGFKYGLGYHFVISNGTSGKRDGQVEIGPRWRKQIIGAHCSARRMNYVSVGVCVVGNLDDQYLTSAQFESLVRVVQQLRRKFNIPVANVRGHNEMDRGTKCPGKHFPWKKFRKELKRRG